MLFGAIFILPGSSFYKKFNKFLLLTLFSCILNLDFHSHSMKLNRILPPDFPGCIATGEIAVIDVQNVLNTMDSFYTNICQDKSLDVVF